MQGAPNEVDPNIFVEQLWPNFKYEEAYLKAYPSAAEAREGIAAHFDFYNHERVHQALDYRAPRQVFTKALRRGSKTVGANCELVAQ